MTWLLGDTCKSGDSPVYWSKYVIYVSSLRRRVEMIIELGGILFVVTLELLPCTGTTYVGF